MTTVVAPPQAVAVTGASGFIGARLTELLAADNAFPEVRALTRRKVDRKNAIALRVDNETELRSALQGCRSVVHCAFDFHNLPLNVEIARTLARACVANRSRLVQLSSWAVYGPVPDGDLDEGSTIRAGGDAYKDVKIAIEELLLRSAREDGLEVIILQPTIVYGPFGGAWTDSPVRELLTGRVVLPDLGEGICNAVYVDDVCQAAISALGPRAPSGKRFLISGPEPVSWREFFSAYETILGVRSLELAAPKPMASVPDGHGPLSEESQSPPSRARDVLVLTGKRLLARHLDGKSRARLNLALQRMTRRVRGDAARLPTGSKLALYRAKCRVRTDNAARELGYVPQFDLVRGMAATASYLRSTYIRN